MKGIILLLLLLLLAGVSQADKAAECRVHRNPYTHTAEIELGCVIKPPKSSGHIMNWHDPKFDSCEVDSHYIDTCAVKMRCDTVGWSYTYYETTKESRRDSVAEVHCYPDTAESDSLPIGQWEWNTPYHVGSIRDSMYLRVTAAELADLREMLREWREKRRKEAIWRCIRDYMYRSMTDWSLRMTGDQLEDSCRCLYGGGK